MKVLRDVGLLYKRKLMETLRNPVYIVMSMLTPVLYLVLFSPLLSHIVQATPGRSVLDVFVPGLLVIVGFFNGLFVGYGIIDEIRNGVIERFRAAPTSRFAILAGPVLRDMTNVLAIVTLFTLVSIPFGFHLHLVGWLITLVLICLLIITTASFGYGLGLILKEEDKLSPIVQGVNLPILLLSGVLLPMELAPTWLQVIAHINPVYYAVEAARLLCAGTLWDPKIGYAFLFMVPLTVLVVAWATRAVRRVVA
jgi:ABC-2 type transport system permease protein